MRITLCLASLFFFHMCSAQEKLVYLNEDGKSVKEKNAVTVEQHLKLNDTLWEVNTYAVDGPRSLSMQFSDDKEHTLNGRYIVYDRKGYCDTIGRYGHGQRQGGWYVMTPKGRALRLLIYDDGKLIAQKDSTQFNEELKKIKDSLWGGRTIVEKESAFPGGDQAWLQFMHSHAKYPQRAFDKNIQGIPIITFIVNKEGHIESGDIYVDRSVEYSLDQEALRVVHQSPDWIPAVQDGKVVKSYKKQPFNFTFSKK